MEIMKIDNKYNLCIMINKNAPVQFCFNCKNLLLDSVKCARCEYENELTELEMTVEKRYPGAKAWVQKHINVERSVIRMPCPECNAPEMYYTSRQLRSADEGETVFLECISCGHKSVI